MEYQLRLIRHYNDKLQNLSTVTESHLAHMDPIAPLFNRQQINSERHIQIATSSNERGTPGQPWCNRKHCPESCSTVAT